jgi:hypothetical protein
LALSTARNQRSSNVLGKYWLNKKRLLKLKDKGGSSKILKLESYKGHLTRSKKKILETLQETQPQSSTSQALVVVSIED